MSGAGANAKAKGGAASSKKATAMTKTIKLSALEKERLAELAPGTKGCRAYFEEFHQRFRGEFLTKSGKLLRCSGALKLYGEKEAMFSVVRELWSFYEADGHGKCPFAFHD